MLRGASPLPFWIPPEATAPALLVSVELEESLLVALASLDVALASAPLLELLDSGALGVVDELLLLLPADPAFDAVEAGVVAEGAAFVEGAGEEAGMVLMGLSGYHALTRQEACQLILDSALALIPRKLPISRSIANYICEIMALLRQAR